MLEKRHHARTKIYRTVVLISTPTKGRIEIQCVAHALDISPKGMMIETSGPIWSEFISVRTLTNDGDTIYIDGRIIYSMPHSPGLYRLGIEFTGEAAEIETFVAECRVDNVQS